MLTALRKGREETDSYDDLLSIMKSIPERRPSPENPSVTDLLGLSEEDLGSVWDRFQFSISKRSIYSENSEDISQLLDNMKTLPIVGRKYYYPYY